MQITKPGPSFLHLHQTTGHPKVRSCRSKVGSRWRAPEENELALAGQNCAPDVGASRTRAAQVSGPAQALGPR